MTKGEPLAPRGDMDFVRERRMGVATLPVLIAAARPDTLDAIKEGVAEAVLFSAGAPVLTETYQLLTKQLNDPKAKDFTLFTAIAVGDSIDHQTNLPWRERFAYIHARPARQGQFLQTLSLLAQDQKPTDESQQAAREFKEALDTTLQRIVTESEAEPDFDFYNNLPLDGFREHVDQVRLVDTFIQSKLASSLHFMGAPGTRDTLTTYNAIKISTMVGTKNAATLLLNGELEDAHGLEYLTWVTRHAFNSITPEKDIQPFSDYYFSHQNLHEPYWENTFDDDIERDNAEVNGHATAPMQIVPMTYLSADYFMRQDEQTAQAFLETVPFGDKPRQDRIVLMRKVIEFGAFFKSLHPDHPNNKFLQDAMQQMATSTGTTKAVRDMIGILTDDQPGILYIEQTPEETDTYLKKTLKMKSPKQGQSIEDLVAGLDPNDIRYISKKSSSEERPTSPVIAIDIAEADPVFFLPAGESIPKKWYWTEGQTPRTENLPALLDHMQTNATSFDMDTMLDFNGELEALQEEHEVLHEIPPPQQAAVIPSLLPEQHLLHPLVDAGILGVIREGEDVSVIVDAQKAKVNTSGPNVVVLRGKLTNTDLEIEGARDFYGTPLNLALAGAALLTRQAPEKSPLPGQKQQDKVKAATLQAREWSAAAKRNQFPIVSPVGPSESEMGVVIPIDKNTVRHFTLEPAA